MHKCHRVLDQKHQDLGVALSGIHLVHVVLVSKERHASDVEVLQRLVCLCQLFKNVNKALETLDFHKTQVEFFKTLGFSNELF